MLLRLELLARGKDASFGHFSDHGLCDYGGATVHFFLVAAVNVDAGPDEEGKVEEAVGRLSLARRIFDEGTEGHT